MHHLFEQKLRKKLKLQIGVALEKISCDPLQQEFVDYYFLSFIPLLMLATLFCLISYESFI